MISVEDAVNVLQRKSKYGGFDVPYVSMTRDTAEQIAELIKHLNNKCELEG